MAPCRSTLPVRSLALVLTLTAGPAVLGAQCLETEFQKLLGTGGGSYGKLGWAVALSGSQAFAGTANKDEVTVFQRGASAWSEVQKIRPSDYDAFSPTFFGASMDADGDVLAVGAMADDALGSNAGAVYVFRRSGGLWIEEQKLLASDGGSSDVFGRDLSVQGHRLVVGADGDSNAGAASGSAYVFEFDGVQWHEVQKLTAADAAGDDNFGFAVALDFPVLAVSAYQDDASGFDSGSAYFFRHDGTQWVEEQKVQGSNCKKYDLFGYSLDLLGGRAVIGSLRDDRGGVDAGAAYVFEWNGSQFLESQILVPSDVSAGIWFGRTVCLSGTDLAVGAVQDDTQAISAGALYLFRDSGGILRQRQKLVASAGQGQDWLGTSLALEGAVVVSGTPTHDDGGIDAGAVWVFELAPLALDSNQDVYAAGDPLAISTCGGLPGGPALLLAVLVNGVPAFLKIAGAPFDGDGLFLLQGSVPPGLSGLQIELMALGLHAPGKVGASHTVPLSFQ